MEILALTFGFIGGLTVGLIVYRTYAGYRMRNIMGYMGSDYIKERLVDMSRRKDMKACTGCRGEFHPEDLYYCTECEGYFCEACMSMSNEDLCENCLENLEINERGDRI